MHGVALECLTDEIFTNSCFSSGFVQNALHLPHGNDTLAG